MNKKHNTSDIRIISVFLLSAAALLMRAFYSFCWSDESFYFSTTARFLKGDAIFVNEWFPTQLVSLILLPFQALFNAVTGGSTGLILYFRIIYVIFSFVASYSVYKLIADKRGIIPALTCGLWTMFYVHLNIATTSYYSLSYFFFLLSMLIIYRYGASDRRRLILAGSLFALAVLSLPSLAVLYFIAAAVLVLLSVKNKKARTIFSFTLIGIVIPAIIVLLYVLPTSTLGGIIHNLQFVLSDEEHTTSLVYPFKNFFISVYNVFGRYPVYLTGLLAAVGLIYSSLGKVHDMIPESMFIPVYFAADLALSILFFTRGISHTGFSATVLLLFAMPLFMIMPHGKKDLPLFCLIFMGGMLFTLVYSYSSLCDLYVLSIGHNISAIAGICFIYDFAIWIKENENMNIGRIMIILAAAVTAALTVQTISLRFVNIYRDAPLGRLDTAITEGPAAGLLTTKEHAASYNEIITALDGCSDPNENIFITKLLPWGYIYSSSKVGAPTTWRTKISSERLKLYYDEHPEKFPDTVLVLNDEIGSYDTCGDVEADPNPNENDADGYLVDELVRRGYKKTVLSVGTVYENN